MVNLLAKPDTPLITHLREVTHLGEEIAQRLGLPERLQVKAVLACALHDIGKMTKDFQAYMEVLLQQGLVQKGKVTKDFQAHIRGEQKRAYPHALASFPFVFMAEIQLAQFYDWGTRSLEATAAVLTHHSPLGPTLYKGYEKPEYHPDLLQVLREVWGLLESHKVRLPDFETFWQRLQSFLQNSPAALLDESLQFNGERQSLRGILQRLSTQEFAQVKAVLHLADWLASAKRKHISALFLHCGLPAVEQHIQKLQRDTKAQLWAFQIHARKVSKADVLWLRAPTGTGKTEALLLWAGDTERLIYLLPTQATTNAMWKRLRRVYGENAVGLSHGRTNYMLCKSTEKQEPEEDPLDERLFGSVFATPVTVATLDQYLLAHLHGRHWEERRTFARKATVILDEIHAYEPYTLGLLLEALKRERPNRLALASATLPNALLKLFPHGRLVEAEPALWERQRHKIQLREGKLLEDGSERALEFARQGKSVLLIANTVRDAQTLFRRLKEEYCWKDCELLHSRFTLGDRMQKEVCIETPRAGRVLVATQVVEVSLDISYDVLVTEVAPIDALVQRLGRVNRRAEKGNAPVVIYTQWSEGAQRIYGKEVLSWSLEILQRLPQIPTDANLLQATQVLYERLMDTEEWRRELEDGRATLDEVQCVLGCYTINLSDEEMRARFTARRGTVSIEVLPEQFVNLAYDLKGRGEGWRIPELLIPVPIYWLKIASSFFTMLTDLQVVQTSLPYDPEIGLQLPLDSKMVQPGGVFLE